MASRRIVEGVDMVVRHIDVMREKEDCMSSDMDCEWKYYLNDNEERYMIRCGSCGEEYYDEDREANLV